MIFYRAKSGYTLLFATLIATLVLGVAAFILGVARKQYILSSTARDSMYSFYAADSGIECLSKDAGNGILISTTTPLAFHCANNVISTAYQLGNLGILNADAGFTLTSGHTYEIYVASTTLGFSVPVSVPSGTSANNNLWGCALVTVYQLYDTTNPLRVALSNDEVISRGYNLCTSSNVNGTTVFSPDTSSRTVERALQWNF